VAFSKDLLHLPLFLPFDDFGRRFNEVWTVLRSFFEWGQQGSVEYVMYSPSVWELEAVGNV